MCTATAQQHAKPAAAEPGGAVPSSVCPQAGSSKTQRYQIGSCALCLQLFTRRHSWRHDDHVGRRQKQRGSGDQERHSARDVRHRSACDLFKMCEDDGA
eukprot:9357-Heterococcus_DN1.PRE.2